MRAVRPANRPRVFPLPALRLNREDLDELVALFRKRSPSVTLMDEEFSYDTVEEMGKGGRKTLGFFHLTALVPHAELWIKGKHNSQFQRSAILILENSDPANNLLLASKELLLSRRWTLKTTFLKAVMVIAGLLLLTGLFLKDAVHGKWLGSPLLWNFTVLIVMAVLMASIYNFAQPVSLISLEYRAAERSFWNRNKDDILKYAIGALIGGVVTLLVAWITHHFFNFKG
jgi:hypothetical protein